MYSFDVFDTLVTRSTATFDGIFLIIQKYLMDRPEEYTTYLRENFYRLRIQSELFTRNIYCKGDIEEITLLQIYQTMALMGGVEKDEILKLKKLEEDIEIENIVGIEVNIEKVRKLVSLKERVVAISDMYLGENIIRKMFDKVGIPQIPIYVSSETHLCKWTGNMYRYVMRKENISYQEWYHMGDNIDSDYTVPSRYGILSKHYPFIEFGMTEEELLKQNRMEVQLLLGTIKNTIINEQLRGISVFGVKVAAMIFYPYVRWMLDICSKKNIKHLYFVHMYGDIIKEICDRIIEAQHYEITTLYVEKDGSCFENNGDKAFVCLTNDKNTRQILNQVLQKQEYEIMLTLCYFVKDMEEYDNYHYLVYACLNSIESNILCCLSGICQNKNNNWDHYMRGIQGFTDSILKSVNIENWNWGMDFSLFYIKELLSSKEKKVIRFVTSFVSLKNDDENNYKKENFLAVSDLKENDKVIVYGAGSLGQYVYSEILKYNRSQIVLWVDRWYEDCVSRGLKVESPIKIRETDFDFILISVVDEQKAKDIKQNLSQMGIEDDKILWINSYDF